MGFIEMITQRPEGEPSTLLLSCSTISCFMFSHVLRSALYQEKKLFYSQTPLQLTLMGPEKVFVLTGYPY